MAREADPYVRVEDDVVVVGVPPEDRMGRGLWLAFVVPLAMVVLVWGVAAIFEPTGWALGMVAVVGALLVGVPGITGMVLVATASRRAKKERVILDVGERLITFEGEEPDVLHDPIEVRVTRTRGLPGGWSLTLVDDEGMDEIVRHIPRTRGRALARAADRLAEALEVPATVPKAARQAPLLVPERSAMWAALCYAPVPIVAEAYAFWALATSRKSGIRFVAKQSFVQLVLELFFGFMVLGCIGAPVVLASNVLPFGFRFSALACPLSVLFLLRTAIRMYAGMRSIRRDLWVFPWLAPLTRRWLPPEYMPSSARRPARPAPASAASGSPSPPNAAPAAERWVSPPSAVPGPDDARSTKVGGPW